MRKLFLGLGGMLACFLLLGLYFFASYEPKIPSYGRTFYAKEGEPYYHLLSEAEEWHMQGKGEISPKLKKAVLCFEDKNFYRHPGVDPLALGRALVKNVLGRRRSGASTLTMQLVKALEPKRRSYWNKYRELWEALRLETIYSKEEILRLYLNTAPYGGNIRGYETAARMYFQKSSEELSWAEAALLAVLPNAPGLMHVERNRKKLLAKRNALLARLEKEGGLSPEEYRFALLEELPKKRVSLNRAGFHFVRKLGKGEERDLTTLDLALQEKIEDLARDYTAELQKEGEEELAVLVIENKEAKIRAYYGSGSYWDLLSQKRSPGSTLKPFLYAWAIEKGLSLPGSLYPDVPSYFGNFAPQNADHRFRGLLSMEEALQRSYNLPFVYLLKDYGADAFFYKLQDSLGRESWENRAGLSLILGGEEYSALELAYLYTALARGGVGKELSFLEGDSKNKEERRLFTKGASRLTRESLKGVLAPQAYRRLQEERGIAWKTGTSFGGRDAWACGFTDRWCLVVWVGNIAKRGNPKLRGDETAGELFFRVLPYLEEEKQEGQDKDKKEDLRYIRVDAQTGYRAPLDFKGKTKEVLAPKSGELLRTSPYWKKIFVSAKGEEVDSRSLDFLERRPLYVLSYPEEVQAFYAKESYGQSFAILYPEEGLELYLAKDFAGKGGRLLCKIANPKKEKIFWYLNGDYIGEGREEERLLSLYPGDYSLRLISESGEEAKKHFRIAAFSS